MRGRPAGTLLAAGRRMALGTELRSRETALAEVYAGYGGGRPLAPYAALVGVWSSLLVGFLGLSKLLKRDLPKLNLGEIVLLAGATAQLSRLITKDAVTSPLRAPFTHFVEPGGPGEVNEEPRKDTQWRHAIGEMLTCPFCMATWVGAILTYGMGLAPRFTRTMAGFFCTAGLANIVQLAYGTATKKAEEKS